MIDRGLVILSVYDSGYCATLLEGNKITDLDDNEPRADFKSRFGKYPENITLEELRKHYPEGTIIVICRDGGIYNE